MFGKLAGHQNWPAACEALLEYYKHVENPAFPTPTDKPPRNNAAIARADAVLNDTFTFYDQRPRCRVVPTAGCNRISRARRTTRNGPGLGTGISIWTGYCKHMK